MKNQITIVGLRTEVYPVLMVTCRADHVTQALTPPISDINAKLVISLDLDLITS